MNHDNDRLFLILSAPIKHFYRRRTPLHANFAFWQAVPVACRLLIKLLIKISAHCSPGLSTYKTLAPLYLPSVQRLWQLISWIGLGAEQLVKGRGGCWTALRGGGGFSQLGHCLRRGRGMGGGGHIAATAHTCKAALAAKIRWRVSSFTNPNVALTLRKNREHTTSSTSYETPKSGETSPNLAKFLNILKNSPLDNQSQIFRIKARPAFCSVASGAI